jgi:hypothetical protein
MKQPLLAGVAMLLAIAPGAAMAQDATDYLRGSDVDLSITDDALQALFTRDAGAVGLPGQELSLGLLLSEDRDIVGTAQVMVPATVNTSLPVTFKFGGKALAGLLDEGDDVVAFAPGAEARFNLSAGRPMAVVGNIFYAPDILTFGNADNVLDFNVRYEVGFTDRATGYAGYRVLTFDRDPGRGEDDIAEGLQIGVRFAF